MLEIFVAEHKQKLAHHLYMKWLEAHPEACRPDYCFDLGTSRVLYRRAKNEWVYAVVRDCDPCRPRVFSFGPVDPS